MTFDEVRQIAFALPGVEEGPCYGTPGLRCRGKILARLWPDGEVLVLARVSFDEREFLMEADPETFFITDHYRNYPSVLARLERLDPPTLKRLLTQAWRQCASKAQLAAHPDPA
jgi:hypothetical protein